MRRTVAAFVALAVLLAICLASGLAFRGYVNEMQAPEVYPVRALKTIATAESIYRESKEMGAGVYGTLEQLRAARAIDSGLGSGTKRGYVFEAHPSTRTSEFLWFAVAKPQKVEAEGTRAFFVNQTGVVHYRALTRPDELAALVFDAETAAVPSGWTVVGK